MSAGSKIVRAIAEDLFGDVGCTDGGCIYGSRGGMVTNGGCCCSKERNWNEQRLHALKLSTVAKKIAETLHTALLVREIGVDPDGK